MEELQSGRATRHSRNRLSNLLKIQFRGKKMRKFAREESGRPTRCSIQQRVGFSPGRMPFVINHCNAAVFNNLGSKVTLAGWVGLGRAFSPAPSGFCRSSAWQHPGSSMTSNCLKLCGLFTSIWCRGVFSSTSSRMNTARSSSYSALTCLCRTWILGSSA